MTNNATEILGMIERVSPEDVPGMDALDVKVLCWLNDWQETTHLQDLQHSRVHDPEYFRANYPLFTRSRDALKNIRPLGYNMGIYFGYRGDDKYYFVTGGNQELNPFENPIRTPETFITEELAELHAIIQAIAYERARETSGDK